MRNLRLVRSELLKTLVGYLAAISGVALITIVIRLIPGADHITNISLLYLLIVMASAYRLGSGPAVLAALLAVLLFNWFFVEPRYTFSVHNPAEWLTLGIFLITAIVINQLTQNLRLRVEEARQRERETLALSQASWAVASQVSHQRTLTEVLQQMTGVIPSDSAAIVVQGLDGAIEVVASNTDHHGSLPNLTAGIEFQSIEAIFKQGAAIHRGAAKQAVAEKQEVTAKEENARSKQRPLDEQRTLDRFASPCYLPLVIEQRVLGVLFLCKRGNQSFLTQEWHLIEALANHAAVALERHRLTQAQTQAEALGEADKLKTALLSMVSHDFRSPLAAIKASVTSLLQDDLPWDVQTERELLVGINQETDRVSRMVGDILALSRLEADAWRPQRELVSIDEIISAALDSFSEEENQRISVHMETMVREVALDSVQIVQILYNLLENALKYSPSDSEVELRLTQCDQTLRVAVLDHGYGLPFGEEEHIFERFYRASRWRESALPGTGIGLAICRGLAEAHGGSLEAHNRDGGGAVFCLMLPLVVPQSQAETNADLTNNLNELMIPQ